MSEIKDFDKLFKWICVLLSLLINITFVYVSVNSILVPIYLAGTPISFFSSLCILTVIESFLFLVALPPSVREEIKKIIVESSEKSNSDVFKYITVNTFYFIVKTVIDFIHLLIIILLALIV